MVYQVTLKKRVIKALSLLNEPNYSSIKKAIYNLAENPRPHGYKKLKGRNGYRIRVGEYRIVYTIHDAILTVEVLDLGHRKEIYG
jgi:mRNA interferase RelE/StbE